GRIRLELVDRGVVAEYHTDVRTRCEQLLLDPRLRRMPHVVVVEEGDELAVAVVAARLSSGADAEVRLADPANLGELLAELRFDRHGRTVVYDDDLDRSVILLRAHRPECVTEIRGAVEDRKDCRNRGESRRAHGRDLANLHAPAA